MKTSLLLIAFVAFASACARNAEDPRSAPPDPSTVVAAQIAGKAFQRGNTFLTVGKNGDFELIFDAHVRYFSAEARIGKARESDAMCLLKIAGKAEFASAKNEFVEKVGALAAARFVVEKAEVITSTVNRPDLTSVRPEDLCGTFAKRMVQVNRFKVALTYYDANQIELVNLAFDVPAKDGWEYNSEERSANSYDLSLHRNHFSYIRLVVKNGQGDAGDAILNDLLGTFTNDGPPSATISFSEKSHQLFFLAPACHLAYRFGLEAIYFDKDGLHLRALPFKLDSAEDHTLMVPADCVRLTAFIDRLSAGPVELSYRVDEKDASISFPIRKEGFAEILQFKRK